MATTAARNMTTALKISPILPILLLVFGTLYGSSYGQQKTDQTIPECSEMASKSQCWRNSGCRWCQSEDLDDMCFSKSESLRLPSQEDFCGCRLVKRMHRRKSAGNSANHSDVFLIP